MSFGIIEIFFQVEVMHDKLVGGGGQERYLPKKGKKIQERNLKRNPLN